ncbi:MAG: hypothetical protein OXF02_04730 [Simkaniaceae bacterium]|nr:hypothetical protein [Simkaniaceae bacterium]
MFLPIRHPRLALFSVLFSTLLSGCNTRHLDSVSGPAAIRYQGNDRAKPAIAIAPVLPPREAPLSSGLTEEFTEHLRQYFLKRRNLRLATAESEEFVARTELIEHDIVPKKPTRSLFDMLTPSRELVMTMRIRVFDLRRKAPLLILQEIVRQSYLVPESARLEESDPDRWRKVSFAVTPIGLAHARFAKVVAKRIEEYVLSAKHS